MAGPSVRKEGDQEKLQLQQLERFLRERKADYLIYLIRETPEMDLKKALHIVIEEGKDELVVELLKEHPWIIKMKGMPEDIALWGGQGPFVYMIKNYPEVLKINVVAQDVCDRHGDDICMYVIDNYPEVLTDGMARIVAEYRSKETCMHMIDKYPWVLKDKYIAWKIAYKMSDEELIDTIKGHPEVPRMEGFIYGLANANKSKALTYILLVRGEIRSNDKDLIASQFNMMLHELNDYDDYDDYNYYKERVMKRIFFDREAIGYRKELNSMGPLYRALLEMLNVSKESAEKLAKELSKAEGNVRKALPLRGLSYALVNKSGRILNLFIKNSRSVMNSLTIFPTVYELRYTNIIGDSEFQQILNSEDKEAELFKQLVSRVESTFNVKPKSEDAIKAMSDYIFLDDLFGLYAKYHQYNKQAESILINAVRHYFEGGIKEFKEFKFGHDLAKEQLSNAYNLKEKFMDLDKLTVTYTSKHSMPYDSVENDINNFLNHKDKLLMIFKDIEEDANSKLLEISKSVKSEKLLASLLISKDLDGLTSHSFGPDYEKVKAKGIALIKLLRAKESFDYINNIVNELQKMPEKSKEEQDLIMEEIAKKVAKWVDNKGFEPLSVLKNYIDKSNKQFGISANDLYNVKFTLNNAKSIVNILLNYSKPAGEAVTAQFTFDPSKILTFGRYGSSGAGNCQNSNGSVEFNQSLMSMLGDANQFMIVFYKANDIKPLGFMQVHLLKSKEKGMIFFMERPYTNEPDKSTAMKEAARMLAQKIKNETGFDCYTYGEVGDKIEKLKVRIPSSPVPRYIDFVGLLLDPGTFDYEIPKAKCLNSDPLFGLKRQ